MRGPVPEVVETFELTDHDDGTRLVYRGTIGTDLWAAGSWWRRLVARTWEQVVADAFAAARAEAERRARAGHR